MGWKSRKMVVAIDFGTTYSGYAFSLLSDFKRDPTDVCLPDFQVGSMMMPKMPTSVLFQRNKMFHSFGVKAEEDYTRLLCGSRRKAEQWYFFRRFKLELYNYKKLRGDLQLPDYTKKKGMPALKVFSAAIGYLKEHVTVKMFNHGNFIPSNQITWVLTVPAMWDDAAKEFMRAAAKEAGIPREQLVLALEPEAASVYCLLSHKSRQISSPLNISQPGKKFILVDCGGEAIHISAFEVREENRLQHLHRPEGTCQGGIRVDEAFKEFLMDLLGTDHKASFDNMELLELMREFERAKCSKVTSDEILIKMPSKIKRAVEEAVEKIRRDPDIRSYTLQGKVGVVRDNIMLDRGLFLSFFKKSAQSIAQSIQIVMAHDNVGSVDAILLTGAFSKSVVIQDAIREAFPRDLVLVEPSPSAAVLMGAVMYGHNPDVIDFSERERLTPELQKMKENKDKKRETERLTQELQEVMKEKEDNKRETERLTQELQKMMKEKEDTERVVKQLKGDIQQMRTEKEQGEIEAKRQTASLMAELEKMKKEMKDADREAQRLIGSLTEELQKVKTEKEDKENERNAQIATLEEELLQVQRDRSTLTAEAEKTAAEQEQERLESAEIQRKAEATIETLQGQLENTLRAEEKTRRALLEKTEHCNSLGGLVAKLETEKKQLHKEVVALQRKLRQAQKEMQEAEDRHCLKLEKEMQVSEEFRRQLQRLSEESDFRQLIKESLQRVEDSLNEVAANMEDTNYRSESSLDRDFMSRLPDDVKRKCLQIQSLIGGMGREFGQNLLGRHVAWSREELEGSGLFFTRSKFWLCIRKWVEASSIPNTDVPLTLNHLTSVCNRLSVNPTSLTEMSMPHVEVLEGNFTFLAESMLVVDVVDNLRNSTKLTEEARAFLLNPGTTRQKVDRLLAVLYSLGEEGYHLLLEALVTQQPHVVQRLKEDEAAITRTAQATQAGEGTEEPRQVSDPGQSTTHVRDDDTDNCDDVQRDEEQGPNVLYEDRQAATLQELQRLLEERLQATTRQMAEECRFLIHSMHEHISAHQSKIEQICAHQSKIEGKLDTVKNTVQNCFDEMYKDIRVNLSKQFADK